MPHQTDSHQCECQGIKDESSLCRFLQKGSTRVIWHNGKYRKMQLTQYDYLTSQQGQNLWGLWFCSTRSAMQENRGSASALSSFPGLWIRTLQNKPKTSKEWTTDTWIRGMVGHTHSNAKDNFTVVGSAIFNLNHTADLLQPSKYN